MKLDAKVVSDSAAFSPRSELVARSPTTWRGASADAHGALLSPGRSIHSTPNPFGPMSVRSHAQVVLR
eukprot:3186950-Prymnesium_polylepis.1